MKTRIFLALLFIPALVFAGPKEEGMKHEKKEMPESFSKLASLVGTWEGNAMMHGKETKVSATYELTSGGTALLERTFPGTPQEMVSVYHADGNKIVMTHYCALGNAPKMKLKSTKDGRYEFRMRGRDGIRSKKEPHMRALTISWKDPDHMQHEWEYYDGGKKKDSTVISMARKK